MKQFLSMPKFDEEFNSYYEKNPINFSMFDTIEMSKKEIKGLFNDKDMEVVRRKGFDYLYEASLPEFVLKITDKLENCEYKIVFKKSCIDKPFKSEYNGEDIVYKNVIDAFIFKSNDIIHQMTFGFGLQESGSKYSYEISMDKNDFLIFTESGVNSLNTFDCKEIKFLYMLIQHIFYNRPTMFIQRGKKDVLLGTKIKKTKNQTLRKRIVKTIKYLSVNTSEYNNYFGSHHVINCPSWGVIGHIRTYKSGKKVWIKPYRKGKERKNTAVYSSKDYDLVTNI